MVMVMVVVVVAVVFMTLEAGQDIDTNTRCYVAGWDKTSI